jgi:D-alanyl-D-alanine carboxypeptidase
MIFKSAIVAAAMAVTVAAPASASPAMPPLDRAALGRAIASLPDAEATAAQVRVGGSAGSWSGRSGVADLTSGTPMPANAEFRIGSITKVFTAVVALQLVAEHKIGLGRTIQAYLPGLLPADYPPITVGELLNHTSGLPDTYAPRISDDIQWQIDHRFENWAPVQLVKFATGHPMEFTPGDDQEYIGVDYVLIGLLIEKETGGSYAHEVSERILRPLGLDHTYDPGDDPRIRGPHAHGYQTVASGALTDVTDWNQSEYWATGSMISTTADLERFIEALFRGELLPRAELAQMFTVPDVPYLGGGRAYYSGGLMRVTVNGITGWGKTGGRPGYLAGMFADRALTRTLVYTVNGTDARDTSEPEIVNRIVQATYDPEAAQ